MNSSSSSGLGSQTEVHDTRVINVDWLDEDPSWLAANLYVRVGSIPSPIQSILGSGQPLADRSSMFVKIMKIT